MRPALIVAALLGVAPAARAEIQKGIPEVFPSKHELSANLGFQAGFGGDLGTPSGFKLGAEYAYRFHELAWWDLRLHNVFGFGVADGFCPTLAPPFAKCYRGGWDLEIATGVKLKIRTRIPLVIEVPLLVGVDVLYNRECSDNGAALVARVGGGVKYFLTKSIGVGATVDFGFGPAFHASTICRSNTTSSYTDFFGAFDFLLGAEFLL